MIIPRAQDNGDPQPVRPLDGELALDQVTAGLRGGVTDGAATASAPVETLDANLAHEPSDPLEIHLKPQPERQFGVDPRRTVRFPGVSVNPCDLFEQVLILLVA
jgi:hypothetical protein